MPTGCFDLSMPYSSLELDSRMYTCLRCILIPYVYDKWLHTQAISNIQKLQGICFLSHTFVCSLGLPVLVSLISVTV